ncbi:hypothetical protein Gogos_020062, partial [Gossypium gossypioides]|nr:hypothetical protein [Gossypium gossypioides]
EKLVLREVFTSVQDSGLLSEYIRTYVFLVDRKLNMEKRFLDKVEDNAAVQTWSEITQQKKGDSLAEGYVSESWNFTRISVDKHLFRALAQFWNAAYSCFTFEGVNLVPTVEEYMALLRCSKI